MKNKLDASTSIPLSPDGDKYVRSEDNILLVKVVGTPSRPETFALVKFRNQPFPRESDYHDAFLFEELCDIVGAGWVDSYKILSLLSRGIRR